MKKAIFGLIGLVMIYFGIGMFMNLDHKAFLVRAYTGTCVANLHELGKAMDELVNRTDKSEPAFELRPEHTVSDLIREIVSRGIRSPEVVCCKHGDGLPYLVFPVSASVFLKDNKAPRVPVLMDRLDSHRESAFLLAMFRLYPWYQYSGKLALTSRVLYSDWSIETLTREDAEKLISEKSPVPITLPADFQSDLRAVREKALELHGRQE